MYLNHLLTKLPFYSLKGKNPSDNISISNVQCDSRFVSENSIFICLTGHTVDGHDFVSEAIKKGAIVIIHEKELDAYFDNITYIKVNDTNRTLSLISNVFFNQPSNSLKIIGVTGTNGKTTITNLIHSIMNFDNKNCGLIGTINTKYADFTFDSTNTTPNSLELQRTFSKMNDFNTEFVAMEVSSHALILGRTWGTNFDTAIFTNLTQDHLDFHKNMDEYATAKSLLFSRLSIDKNAIINIDDPMANFFIEKTQANVITYGIKNTADYQAINIKLSPKGTSFDLVLPNKEVIPFNINLIGKFNIYNTLAAIASCISHSISIETIQLAFNEIKGVDGRFESVDVGQEFSVIVDYAHTPDSLENVLQTAKELTSGRVITVVGCGGDRDKTKRPIMAKIAQDYSDFVVITSDNPRTEEPKGILNDMIRGLDNYKNNYIAILEREKGIDYAINSIPNLSSNDTILIVGKGHETYQIIGREKIHFDDREHAKNSILSLTL